MKYRRLRKGRCLVCLLSLFLVFNFCTGLFTAKAETAMPREMIPVYIHQGDTLWNLVDEYYDYQGDIRSAIHEVEQLNQMSSAEIQAGEVIYIPVH